MNNKDTTATFQKDCQTASIIRVKSNGIAMIFSFAGWLFWLAVIFGFGLIETMAHTSYYFGRDLDSNTLFHILGYGLMIVSTLVFLYQLYFPRQWMTSLTVNLEDKSFTIVSGKETRILPFSQVSQVVHQGVATLFATNYLFWAEVEGERIPLVAFSSDQRSLDFFLMLDRRSGLKLFREAGN